jgi:hypothetical protein
MPTGDLSSQNTKNSNATLWLPPLSLQDQQRINQQRKRHQRKLHSWLATHGFGNRTTREHLEFFAIMALPVILTVASIVFSILQSQAAANDTAAQSHAAAVASAW